MADKMIHRNDVIKMKTCSRFQENWKEKPFSEMK